MTDITQSENPVLNQPVVLDEEALKPMSLMDRMVAEASAIAPPADAGPRKRRGRPPGSRNRATVEAEQAGITKAPGGARMIRPPGGSTDKPKEGDEPTAAQLRAIKEARVVELTQKITDGINDNLMLLLSSAGVPSKLLYKPGFEPAQVEASQKFTDFARNVTISPTQANLYAHFIAEAEKVPMVENFVGKSGGGNGPLIVYGVLSLAASIQYVKGLQEFATTLKPLLEAKAAADRAEALRKQQQGQTTDVGG